ncbi:tRNA(Glu)-specific nuclease WapA precursor [Phycisphaerae bacterium RAS1]|nr:tRNA(Glu)-specific nuclease WapA precursor [Phycisphaerae bacterium RAS1]
MNNLHFTYAYEPIGNRTDASCGQEKPVEALYDRNALNQYDQVRSDEAVFSTNLTYDADGNLTGEWLDGDCNCDGQVNITDIGAFNLAVSDPEEYAATYPECTLVTADANNDGDVDVLDINPFVALLGAGGAGGRTLRWDAENRLIEVCPTGGCGGGTPAADEVSQTRSVFDYDYQNRRVRKRVYAWTPGSPGSWSLTKDVRFVYDGWRVLLELDGLNSNAIIRKYTWGLDLAGLNGAVNDRESAGGIGGLLAVYDTNGTTTGENPEADDLKYVYLYDANGNVGQLIDVTESTAASSIKARYEYDPYGNVVASSGTYAETNTYRFSTKPWDDETGLGYWGERYYDPRLGRWISRDPIGEAGGDSLVSYCQNQPSTLFDPIGLDIWAVDPPPRDPKANQYCSKRYGDCSTIAAGGWRLFTTKKGRVVCICGGYKYTPLGGFAKKRGISWPACCAAAFGSCVARGGAAATECSQILNRCMDSLEDNPCHEGNEINRWCWHFTFAKDCDRPESCFLPLFSLCDTPAGRFLNICGFEPTKACKDKSICASATCEQACREYAKSAHCRRNCGASQCNPNDCPRLCREGPADCESRK